MRRWLIIPSEANVYVGNNVQEADCPLESISRVAPTKFPKTSFRKSLELRNSIGHFNWLKLLSAIWRLHPYETARRWFRRNRFRESEVKFVSADAERLRGFENLVKRTPVETNHANPDNDGKHLSAAYERGSL